MTVPVTLTKRPGDIRAFGWDFKNYPEIVAGDTISVASSIVLSTAQSAAGFVDTNPLVIGAPSISGTQIVATLSAGTAGAVYTLLATGITLAGATLTVEGLLVMWNAP